MPDYGPGLPTAAELSAALRVRPGAPATRGDMERDVARLVATGLFSLVRGLLHSPRPSLRASGMMIGWSAPAVRRGDTWSAMWPAWWPPASSHW